MDSYSVFGDRENSVILARAFLDKYISVVKLDVPTGRALVLKSELDSEIVGLVFSWPELVLRYKLRRAYPPDSELLSSLTLERLREVCIERRELLSQELRCTDGSGGFQWVQINAEGAGPDGRTVLVTTRDINEDKLMRKILDLFVYRNYDYLYLIDAKNDTYTRFTGNKGNTPVPPEKGDHYTRDMLEFNRRYVTPEDFESVTANMQLPHVMRMLERSDTYSFTSGGITKDGRYRRSQLMYFYYDKSAGLILNARINVTQIYLEEQEKKRRLSEALRSAQHDAMTDLYNSKATAELVKRSLESQYRSTAALFFIDVDNFKMVNDTLGHQKGDELLCFLAHYIQVIAGRTGIAGRLGGDEYLLYLPGVSSIRDVEQTARQICRSLDSCSDLAPLQEGISCSVGVSLYPGDGTDYETLLRKADQALYASKRNGKKQYIFYSSSETALV